jgi:tetratricopeptide (TPR) repeat protein
VNNRLKFVLLVLLVMPLFGLGQQPPASGFEASRFESLVAAAQKAEAVSDYAGAASDYKQAVKLRPDIPELWANLGLMQHQSGDLSGAIVSLQQANRLNPALYVPNLFLGVDYVRTGKTKEAIPLLIKAEKTNKTDPQAALALGRAYISAGKFSAAAEELLRATQLDPKLGSAWFTLGIAHLDQVEVDARTLSAQGKESPFAGALFAESLQKQARFGEAATLYESLLDSQPQPPCLRSELGFSLLRGHDSAGAATAFATERAKHPECGLAILGQARMAIDSGDNEQAVGLLNELWGRDHGFVTSNAAILLEGISSEKASSILSAQNGVAISTELAKALLTAFNYSSPDQSNSDAVETSSEQPREAPGRADQRTAEELYASGQFRQCAHRLESSIAALGADKLRLLAACAFFTGDNQLASRAAMALETAQPRSLEALYWSIQANERLALECLARFQQLEPDSARSHVLLGDIYHQLERHDDAQAEYLKAIAISPDDPAALLGLASAYLSNNNDDGAMATARTALARTPEDPELNLIMGEAMLARNDYTGSEPYLLKALKAKPQMVPRVHALIGKAYAETGRTQEAIDQLKLGASSDEDGAIQYLLARLYRKIGDTKDAMEALDRMKVIKQQRRDRGVKRVEDPDLSSLEFPVSGAAMP